MQEPDTSSIPISLPSAFVAALADLVVAVLVAAGKAETLEEAEKIPPFTQPQSSLQLVAGVTAESANPQPTTVPTSPACSWHSPSYPNVPSLPLEAAEAAKGKDKKGKRKMTEEERLAPKRKRDADQKRRLRAEAKEKEGEAKKLSQKGGASSQDIFPLSDDDKEGGASPPPKRPKKAVTQEAGSRDMNEMTK